MIVGVTILKMGAAVFYSPQFPRGGLAAGFTADVTGEIGATTMTIDVEHRNLDETTWATVATFPSVTATGVQFVNATGIKEVVRLKYSFTGGSDGDGFHIVVAAPAWRPFA